MTRYNYEATRGARQESRILAALTSSPMTAKELAKTLHTSSDNINIYMHRLKEAPRRIHTSGFQRNGVNRPAQLFALGDEPDAVWGQPKGERAAVLLLHYLKTPHTAAELSALVNLSRPRIATYLKAMRTPDNRCVRICRYNEHDGRGFTIPVYQVGKREDTPMPRRLTRAEKWKREAADPDTSDIRRSRRRAYDRIKRATNLPPQGPFAALFIGVRAGSMNAEG